MIKTYVNDIQIPISCLFYDEWVYNKYREEQITRDFNLFICLDIFINLMKPKYEVLLKELKDDDEKTGENYILEVYGMLNYPSFEDILSENKMKMEDKINFLNTFFIKDILTEFTSKELENKSRDEWIIRKVNYLSKKNDYVCIKGDVQTIIHF
ncbi:MAG: hypothetical protein LBK27_00480 [Treponema sp.]|jgi:hypothetical protein|nr:hypothetical protein [Treponema sp.]